MGNGSKLDDQCGSVRLRQAQFGTSFCNAEKERSRRRGARKCHHGRVPTSLCNAEKREEQAPWCAEMSPWPSADGQEARTWLGGFCLAGRDIFRLPAGGSGILPLPTNRSSPGRRLSIP